jgi:cellulose synthase operon protein C
MRRIAHLVACLFALALTAYLEAQPQQQDVPLVPAGFVLDEAASNAINAAWLTEDERAAMRVFHGVWDERDLRTPALQAEAAVNAWRFDDPVLTDEAVSVETRAEAKLLAGDLPEALELLEKAAGGPRSNRAIRLKAEILEGLGRREEAVAAIAPLVERLIEARTTEPADLVEGVRAMIIRARIEGQPSRDFQTMMNLLARARQELDRLHWPAPLIEAQLLIDKDNFSEGVTALHETLSLNPRCSQAWYDLGRVAMQRFDFASAATAAAALRRLNPQHPLADLLDAEAALTQDDPETAQTILGPLLDRLPNLRPAMAFGAATAALFYSDEAVKAALERYDALSPGSPSAHYVVGRQLSFNRQYEAAAEALEEAIRRAPAWPAPQIELGLMELQSGRDDRALKALQSVAKLDPFNKRAANSLFLLEELATYRQIESEHFVIRYKPGVDDVVAQMMPGPLEKLHEIVSTRFEFTPARKTVIELMPDHQRFAVRITGMPFVHTIAACTGPVIAMEVPREGQPSQHMGPFDWPRVLQHEYTHTITLGQTRNRIPHWLTEASAVSMELRPRGYNTCSLLAQALERGELFNLDEIKWAFVRPRRPNDRALAYAQGHWMVEFMNERFGSSALVRLLARYFDGEREQQAIPNALGVSREQFYTDFLAWAKEQVQAWGMDAKPSMMELTDEIREADPELGRAMEASRRARLEALVRELGEQIGRPTSKPARRAEGEPIERGLTADRWPDVVRPPVDITDDQLAAWLEKYPDHPDLVELQVRRRLERTEIGQETGKDEALIALLYRYMELRPVDPFPHKKLAAIWLASETPQRAIEHLERLDLFEEHSTALAVELAKLYREQGDAKRALEKATRAVHINPYNAPNRELAAAIAIEMNDLDTAKQHIVALTLIEPDRPQHKKRLEAVEAILQKRGS